MGTTTSVGKRLRAKWDADEATFGLWAGIPSSLVAELGAAAGYDFVCVDLQHLECGLSGSAVDGAGAAHLRIIADASQQAVGDAGSAPGTKRNLGSAVSVDGHLQHLGGAFNHVAQLFLRVELQTQQDAKS